MRTKMIFLVAAMVFLAGCASIGPGTIPRDRFDYTSAIAESWKSQMLLNIVKLRYADVPVFLDVASVLSQYSLQGQVNLGAGWGTGVLAGDTQSVGATGTYAERPTITYAPLSGEKFTRSLMTPIPPSALMSLIQSGWPIKLLFGLCVKSINELDNWSYAPAWARPADPKFEQLIDAMAKIQKSGAVSTQLTKIDEKAIAVVLFRRKEDEKIIREIGAVNTLLGLKPGASKFKVIYGSAPTADDEIAILTRSIFEIVVEMSAQIDVPSEHVAERRTYATSIEGKEEKEPSPFRIRVQTSVDKPPEPFAAIQYRGRWFWIDDRDRPSKLVFSFFMIAFSLVETGAAPQAPLITVPVN